MLSSRLLKSSLRSAARARRRAASLAGIATAREVGIRERRLHRRVGTSLGRALGQRRRRVVAAHGTQGLQTLTQEGHGQGILVLKSATPLAGTGTFSVMQLILDLLRATFASLGDLCAPGRRVRFLAQRVMKRLCHVVVLRQTRAVKQGDGAFRIAQAQTEGLVHVLGAGQLLVEATQGCIQVGTDQAVDDAAWKVAADSHLQAGGLEGRPGCGNG
jgi:hypothetical protein